MKKCSERTCEMQYVKLCHNFNNCCPLGGMNSPAAAPEQATAEPKKYMGGSIPSRSFRMLQAMTTADDGKVTPSMQRLSHSQQVLPHPLNSIERLQVEM